MRERIRVEWRAVAAFAHEFEVGPRRAQTESTLRLVGFPRPEWCHREWREVRKASGFTSWQYIKRDPFSPLLAIDD
ncbi:MAG TPA: hypothetical protein VEB69_10385, partial [Acidimicrobiia bacterium]|nr:hypothetical protein [Acidimicrobiia bacterium]